MTATHVNPDIAGARGALDCAIATLESVQAARKQMEKVEANAANPQRGLGNVPVVGEIRAFKASIGACETVIDQLIVEHLRHDEVADFLARDPQLREAADGYLAARHRQ
jgi:hypothetical protein